MSFKAVFASIALSIFATILGLSTLSLSARYSI
jgi:hypothetical protein